VSPAIGGKGAAMRVRCSNCGAEYEAAVTPAGLGWVGRCERCGRSALHPADDEEPAARAAGDRAERRGAPEREP
jgi:ribosomal protein L37E